MCTLPLFFLMSKTNGPQCTKAEQRTTSGKNHIPAHTKPKSAMSDFKKKAACWRTFAFTRMLWLFSGSCTPKNSDINLKQLLVHFDDNDLGNKSARREAGRSAIRCKRKRAEARKGGRRGNEHLEDSTHQHVLNRQALFEVARKGRPEHKTDLLAI